MEQPAVDEAMLVRRYVEFVCVCVCMCVCGGGRQGEMSMHAMLKQGGGNSLSMLSSRPPSSPGTQLARESKRSRDAYHTRAVNTQHNGIQLLGYRGDSLYTNAFSSSFAHTTTVL